MLPLKLIFGRSKDNYFDLLQDLSLSYTDPKKDSVNEKITTIIKDHSNSLIADLVEHPEHSENYQMKGSRLRETHSLKPFQSSLGYIQRIAKCLKNDEWL